jgi:hypothetical protein
VNAVAENLNALAIRNYVRKADPDVNYWVDFAFNRMQRIQRERGDNFFVIVYGSPDQDNDFFVIPYGMVKPILVEETLAHTPGRNTSRWIGQIRDKILRITHSDAEIDLTQYYGNFELLRQATDGRSSLNYLGSEEGEDENDSEPPFHPTDEDWRASVFRQIKERRGQQKFRDGLRKRYGDRCMISGCCLMDVVEAAHINPYRGEKDNHPENGLLLRADLHTLLDLDLLGIEPGTLTVRLHPDAIGAGYELFDGVTLRCMGKPPNKEAIAGRWKLFQDRKSAGPISREGRGPGSDKVISKSQ